jgi:PAS domain S-box-containing protein
MTRGLTFRLLLGSAILLAIVVAGFAVMAAAVDQLEGAGHAEGHATKVLATANALEKATLDLETGLRGYLLTGKQPFLDPYRDAQARYPVLARELESLSSGDTRQRRRVAEIAAAIGRYDRTWVQPLIARYGQDPAAARAAVATGRGKAQVDAIRARFTVFDAAQTGIAARRSQHASSTGSLARALAFGGMAICGLLVLVFTVFLRRTVVTPVQRLARGVERIGAGELSVRVPVTGTGEVRGLNAGFNAMADNLELQRDELENQKAELEGQQLELEAALAFVEAEKAHAELLQRFGDDLAVASGLERVSEVALRELADRAGAEIGALYVLDERSGAFALAARRGLGAGDLAPALVPGEGLAGRALAERRPVSVSYGETRLRLPGLVSGRDAAHELHLPLLHGERTIGVVSLGRSRDEAFGAQELELLAILAERAAVVAAEALSLRRVEGLAGQLETLLASIDQGILGLGRDGRIVLVNRAALELTGYTEDDLLGEDAHALLHHTRPDGTPYPAVECPIFEALANGTQAHGDNDCFWRRDGTSFPVEFASYPLFDGGQAAGGVLTFVDVEDRKRLERQRDTQHAVTAVLADANTTEEAIPRLLDAICNGLGWPLGFAWQAHADAAQLRCIAWHAAPGHEEAAASRAAGSISGDGGPAATALERRETVVAGNAVAVPIVGIDGDLLGIAEFRSDDAIGAAGLVGTLDAIAGQTAQFFERKRAEARTEHMRQEFVATVSHELRTPLTAIEGWLDVLGSEEAGPLNEDQQRFLATVRRNSERLRRLVGDLLLSRQIETGQLSLELEDLDLTELAAESLDLVRASADAKGIELEAQLDGPALVHGDRIRLAQLLGNLLTNAVKFTPEGGAVRVAVSAGEHACRIAVSDTGIGIPRDERDRLFQRFFRATTATHGGISGTGLGLAISKSIAESHGGTIELVDRDGPGTEFVVELPALVRETARR